MASHYASPSPVSYNYQPVSPPWSQGGPSPHLYEGSPRAPVMPYVPLPSLHDYTHPSPHHGLLTPPPTPNGEVHPVLCSHPTVVRYDLANDPRTIRMSSSAPSSSFPNTQPASRPAVSVIHIECQVSGLVITLRNSNSPCGITCVDVLLQLHHYLSQPIPNDEWRQVQEPQRSAMKKACSRRAAASREQRPGMMMVDYLQGQTVFKRLTRKRGDMSGSTWVLHTTTA